MDSKTIDTELDTALAALGPTPPTMALDGDRWPSTRPPEPPARPSPTLASLAESRHPKPDTVCARCPNSVWFASPVEVKCYCRVMYLVTWSTQEPTQLTACDGSGLDR